ncbi:MAG TPA: hypothetical protein VEY51_12035 [Chondromyces sp.]|nr:hypothetical protein [Chondromyces sp.]
MRKKLHFTKSVWNDGRLELHMEQPVEISHLVPGRQMIVDSDEAAFVYLAEEENDFVYLYIHEAVWEDMRNALQDSKIIAAAGSDGEFILEGWQEELTYLVENIEGNSNYGEQMVEKVEKIFLTKEE